MFEGCLFGHGGFEEELVLLCLVLLPDVPSGSEHIIVKGINQIFFFFFFFFTLTFTLTITFTITSGAGQPLHSPLYKVINVLNIKLMSVEFKFLQNPLVGIVVGIEGQVFLVLEELPDVDGLPVCRPH